MSRVIACILSDGDWRAANRAAASAARFGLAVAVGTTGQKRRGAPLTGLRVYPIVWRDDFADARNQLAQALAGDAAVEADYFLWIDSDEELISFPGRDLALAGPSLAVRLIDRADFTARAAQRLQRRKPLPRWRGAIHETLPTPASGLAMVGGILIRHYGYDDARRLAAKRRRNAAIVARARAAGRDDFPLALEAAREARGGAAVLAWLRAFKHPDATPSRAGAFDPRVEAAAALCAYGLCAPAEEVLAANPAIAPLQLALAVAERRATGRTDPARLARIAALIRKGGADPRYAYPAVLARGDPAVIADWIETAAGPKERSAS